MRGLRAAALAATALALASCAPVLLEKGPVARVDTVRQSETASLSCSAERGPGSGLTVHVWRRTELVIERTVRYHTIEWRGSWSWWAEPLELLAAPLALPTSAALVLSGAFPPETGDVRAPAGTKLLLATAPINPAASLWGTRIERRQTVEGRHFADAPVPLHYAVGTPAAGLPVTVRVFGADGAVLADFGGNTDPLGDLVVPVLPGRGDAVTVLLPGGERRLDL